MFSIWSYFFACGRSTDIIEIPQINDVDMDVDEQHHPTPNIDDEENESEKQKNHHLNGVSVYYLRHNLLREAAQAGLGMKATIYDLEDLRQSKHGVIRRKGAVVTCPRDGEIGAAYVDCLEGLNNVGPANRMLSYAGGYRIVDIVDSLESYCTTNNMNPKRTYIWMCCLCNNQHRVCDNISFATFHTHTMVGIGHVLVMMAPWNKSVYMTRIWCIIEMFAADTTDECEVEIIIPPQEKEALLENVRNYGTALKTLCDIDIEKAEATKESDRKNILELTKRDIGVTALNNHVNHLLRSCIEKTLLTAVENCGMQSKDRSVDLDFALLCCRAGRIMDESDKPDEALDLYYIDLAIRQKVYGKKHRNTANAYSNIGMIMWLKGDFDGAVIMYKKCLAVKKKFLGAEHPITAITYNNLGGVMEEKGDLQRALKWHMKALTVRVKVYGERHNDTAVSYNNIGVVLRQKGDLDGALKMYQKALVVRKKVYGEAHASTALSYNSIGVIMCASGDLNGALENMRKCVAVQENLLGNEHSMVIANKNVIVGMEMKLANLIIK